MKVSLQIDKHALDYAYFVLCKSSKTFKYTATIASLFTLPPLFVAIALNENLIIQYIIYFCQYFLSR